MGNPSYPRSPHPLSSSISDGSDNHFTRSVPHPSEQPARERERAKAHHPVAVILYRPSRLSPVKRQNLICNHQRPSQRHPGDNKSRRPLAINNPSRQSMPGRARRYPRKKRALCLLWVSTVPFDKLDEKGRQRNVRVRKKGTTTGGRRVSGGGNTANCTACGSIPVGPLQTNILSIDNWRG
jgi:hypothetical protein